MSTHLIGFLERVSQNNHLPTTTPGMKSVLARLPGTYSELRKGQGWDTVTAT